MKFLKLPETRFYLLREYIGDLAELLIRSKVEISGH